LYLEKHFILHFNFLLYITGRLSETVLLSVIGVGVDEDAPTHYHFDKLETNNAQKL